MAVPWPSMPASSAPSMRDVDPSPAVHSVSYLLPESVSLAPTGATEDHTLRTITETASSSSIAMTTFSPAATSPSIQTSGVDPAAASVLPLGLDGFDNQISKGSIAAATFGAISAVAAIVVVVYFMMLRRKVVRRNSLETIQPEMQIGRGRSISNSSDATLGNAAVRTPYPSYQPQSSSSQLPQQQHQEQTIGIITASAMGASAAAAVGPSAAGRLSWSGTLTPTPTLVPSYMSDGASSEFSVATTAGAAAAGRRMSLVPRMPSGLVRLNTWLQENRRRSRAMGASGSG